MAGNLSTKIPHQWQAVGGEGLGGVNISQEEGIGGGGESKRHAWFGRKKTQMPDDTFTTRVAYRPSVVFFSIF